MSNNFSVKFVRREENFNYKQLINIQRYEGWIIEYVFKNLEGVIDKSV